ncbi:riboflavin synthase domain-like protein, partial [Athelia psychrophila]
MASDHDEAHNATHDDESILILYATETGTAQDAADCIARECRRIHLKCRVSSMHAYPLSELISETTVIFVVSTFGSGTEPRSMTPLWQQLLRSDLPPDLFEDLSFASFGLGDTSYEKFCWPSKLLNRRMENLGGVEICPRGEGDEQHRLGIDGALDPWISDLLEALLLLYPLPPGIEIIPRNEIPPPRVSLSTVTAEDDPHSESPLSVDKEFHTATIKCNTRISAADWSQDVRHFEFEIPDDIQYKPGDVAVIHPEASSLDVEPFLVSMGWANNADEMYRIEHTSKDQSLPDHLPAIATLRQIFTRHLDFNAVPRRSFFQLLRHFTPDELEREKLDEFLSAEGADELYDYCFRVRRTIREVLSEFRSAQIPKEYVFDLFPPMRPREFSISSSIKKHPHQIHLCVAIVKFKTKLKIPRRGVCTSYLAELKTGDSLRAGLRAGLITLPPNPETPIICVGPGTGVAPMRAVIEDRIEQGSKQNTLYFGCRHASKDQHYSAEFQAHAERQDLAYRVACSRDGPEGVKRTYVQDLIEKDGKAVWEALGERGGWLYISGSSNKMPAAVKAAVRGAVEAYGKMSEDEAKEFVGKMESDGKLIEECWS